MRQLAFFLALLLPAVSAAQAETIFKGEIQSTSVSNCPDMATGLDRRSVFHPKISTNQPFTAVTILDSFDSRSYQTDKPVMLNQPVIVTGTGISAGGWTWTGPKLTINGATPPLGRITATTPQLALTFSIENPEKDHSGKPCIIIWQGIYLRDHD